MTDWQPIETAPKGMFFDAWVVPPEIREGPYRNKIAQARRHTDVSYSSTGRLLGRTGQFVEGRWFYDDEGEQCIDPDDRSPKAFRATHWMPLPEPPND